MIIQCTVAQAVGIAIIRDCLRSTCNGQTTIAVESDKGFGKYIRVSCQTTRRREPSLKDRQTDGSKVL